jgi:hypothetical protein
MLRTTPRPLYIWLLAALAVAALLRLGWPGISEFKLDEAHTTAIALEIAEGRSLPLHGYSLSVGLPIPPLSTYLYALPLALWRHPLSATFFVGALSLLAIAVGWWLARRFWGPYAALCASILWAASPWLVMFARKIWVSNLLPLFCVACLATGVLAFAERRRLALVLHLALLTVVVSIHYSGLALVPVTGIFLLLSWRRVDWRALLAGAVLAGLITLPFALYVLANRAEINQRLGEFLSHPAAFDGQALDLWWVMITGTQVHAFAGAEAAPLFLGAAPNIDAVSWIVGLLALGGIGLWLWEWVRRPSKPTGIAGGFVALWALAPLLFFARHSTGLVPHYFLVTFPAPYLAAGYALVWGVRRLPRLPLWTAAGVASVLAGVQATYVLLLLQFLGSHATPDGFGVPLAMEMRAADSARLAGQPVVVASDGENPDWDMWPAVFDVLLRGTPHRFVDVRRAAVFPGQPATLLVAPGAVRAGQLYGLDDVAATKTILPNRLGEDPFVLAADGLTRPILTPVTSPNRLENGAELAGFQLRTAGSDRNLREWWIAWRVVSLPDPAADYHVFNHLLDAGGTPIWQADGPTLPAGDWRAGDYFIQVFPMEVVPESRLPGARMQVGMYTYPAIANQRVLDQKGDPVGQSVEVRPLEVTAP